MVYFDISLDHRRLFKKYVCDMYMYLPKGYACLIILPFDLFMAFNYKNSSNNC